MILAFEEFKQKALGPKFGKMKGDRLYNIERNLSVRMSWVLLKIFPRIRPTAITFLSFGILFFVFGLSAISIPHEYAAYIFIIKLSLLYGVSLTDKVDGEIARVIEYTTQKGLYYDRLVHFIYPFVFYFTIGHYFYTIGGPVSIFYATLFLGVVAQALVFFYEMRLMIGDKIRKFDMEFKDLVVNTPPARRRLPLVLRVVDYLTFMIYAWALFFYIFVGAVSIFYPYISQLLYYSHMVITAGVVTYKVFYSYPAQKLYGHKEAENIRQSARYSV